MIQLIKNIFTDISFVYSNFKHWFISKLLVSIASYLIGIFFSIPFFLVSFLIFMLSPFSLDLLFSLNTSTTLAYFSQNFVWTGVLFLFFIAGVITLIISLLYSSFLLARVNLAYIKRKTLSYKKNKYFHITNFIKFYKIIGIYITFCVFLFLSFSLIFIILLAVFGGSESVGNILSSGEGNTFALLSFIVLLLFIILGGYCFYRIIFASYVLLENSKKTAIWSIKKSIKITKSFHSFGRFIGVMGVLLLVLLPFNYMDQWLNFQSNNIQNYIQYQNIVGESGAEEVLDDQSFYKYSLLGIEYKDLNSKELVGKLRFLNIMQLFYYIINFVLIYGILDLVMLSFYKRELIKK